MRKNTYVLVESVRQGNVDAREHFTFTDLKVLKAALQRALVCQDLKDLERRQHAKLLAKLIEVSK